jgi:hypothetical protein
MKTTGHDSTHSIAIEIEERNHLIKQLEAISIELDGRKINRILKRPFLIKLMGSNGIIFTN